MSATPLISIITPSFNQARFLEQTILSVLNQDYPTIEYLIVDGGSTDGSVDIIQHYADQLTWWVSEKDSGQAEAINKGMKRAHGDIIAWLNSDDIYLPGAVSQAAEILNQEQHLGMIYGDALSIDENGKPIGKFSFGNWGLIDLVSFRIICQPAVFLRRSVLEQVGYLSQDFHFMLDHQLWIRMARLSSIRHIAAHLQDIDQPAIGLWAAARYHQNAKNVSQAVGFSQEIIQVLTWMQTQPDLASMIASNRRRVLAGAYRLNARYLLDGGLHKEALASYWRALVNSPSYGLKHIHRMVFAFLKIIKLDWTVQPFISQKEKKHRKQLTKQLQRTRIPVGGNDKSTTTNNLSNWPGLDLEHE